MLAHHPELDLLPLFRDTHLILKNAEYIQQKDELNLVYFSVNEKRYIATVKATKDKSELYLTTIFKANIKPYTKQLNKAKQDK